MFLDTQLRLGLFSVDLTTVFASIFILASTSLRLFFILAGWPLTNSDEATVGLMALHISQGHDFPAFLYGQGSLGALEAYMGAFLFLIAGPSVLALRLGVLVLFIAFLISMYLLTRLLYSKGLALITLVALSLGTSEILYRAIPAFAGHAETPLFGSLIMLLSTWLGLASQSWKDEAKPRLSTKLVLLYMLWGIICGAALWNDALAAPFILMGGLFMLICCRGTLRVTSIAGIALGLLIGILPMILNDTFSSSGHSSLEVFGFLTASTPPSVHQSLLERLLAAFLVTLPVSTGATELCAITNYRADAWPITAHSSAQVVQCTAVHGMWAGIMLAIWLVALAMELVFLFRNARVSALISQGETTQQLASEQLHSSEDRQRVIRFARLMLLGSAGLTWLVFALSAQSIDGPWINHRYLIGLSVATPTLLWPLWKTITAAAKRQGHAPWMRPATVFAAIIIALFIGTLMKGTVDTFAQIPPTQAGAQQQQALVNTLLRLHIRHMYSDYWTCNLVAFETKEQVICSVLDEQLQPGVNRYAPYAAIVAQDPAAVFLFPSGSAQATAFAQRVALSSQQYSTMQFDNYVLYQPALEPGS